MLAVIPLEQFREIAIAMAVGVIIDAVAVRSLLVPALVALFGRLGMWPGHRRVPKAAPSGLGGEPTGPVSAGTPRSASLSAMSASVRRWRAASRWNWRPW
jgi:uncharacterized membrane protein YdfJ with MMPL/SSD domain